MELSEAGSRSKDHGDEKLSSSVKQHKNSLIDKQFIDTLNSMIGHFDKDGAKVGTTLKSLYKS